MAGDNYWIERAQSAEARYSTLEASMTAMKEKVRTVKETLGVREKSDGSFDIDFDRLVGNLGIDNALAIRRVIDEVYGISGAAGEKPRLKARAA